MDVCTNRGLHFRRATLILENLNHFIKGGKHAFPLIWREIVLCLLNWTVSEHALCSRERHYFIFKAYSLYKHPWKDSLEQRHLKSVCKMCRNRKAPWRSVLTDLPFQSEVDFFIVIYFPSLRYILSIHCLLECFWLGIIISKTYK